MTSTALPRGVGRSGEWKSGQVKVIARIHGRRYKPARAYFSLDSLEASLIRSEKVLDFVKSSGASRSRTSEPKP